MPANYRILADGNFTLSAGQDFPFNFALPDGVILTGDQRPILAFLVRPNPAPGGTFQFRVDCNGSAQVTPTMGGDEKGGFWEVVNNNVAQVGQNTIQFRAVFGSGSVTFSDVVLWFHT